ncbi:serine/threonine-protein kinase 36-like isoform X2 [Heterodontus francisci]|uniref:serine/threonine-protein kinase 36-like isoform X2 n=1 Tax=Heterodontus francisci TaxID=7792 RepID=UPI00355B0CB1
MLHSEGTKQPWCGTVLCDLVTVLTAYFSGDFEAEASGAGSSIQVFEQSAAQFLQVLDQLLTLSTDFEMRLKEQSIRCLMFICETMDQSSPAVSSSFYSHLLCSHQAVLTAVLRGCDRDPRPVQRLESSAEDVQAARERWDRLLAANTATLAALCNVSPGATGCRDAKRKVSEYISDTLFTVDNTAKSIRFIEGIQNKSLCLSALKVLYSCCQVSKAPCQLLVDEALESLLLLLQSEVFPDDPVLSQTVETDSLSLIVVGDSVGSSSQTAAAVGRDCHHNLPAISLSSSHLCCCLPFDPPEQPWICN